MLFLSSGYIGCSAQWLLYVLVDLFPVLSSCPLRYQRLLDLLLDSDVEVACLKLHAPSFIERFLDITINLRIPPWFITC